MVYAKGFVTYPLANRADASLGIVYLLPFLGGQTKKGFQSIPTGLTSVLFRIFLFPLTHPSTLTGFTPARGNPLMQVKLCGDP